MSNPNKKKGTRAESRVVKYLKAHGIDARRKALSGSKDEGDIEFDTPFGLVIIEVKTGKQTQDYNRSQLETWLAQARVERVNAGAAFGYLVIVRHGRRIQDAEVWWPGENMREMYYLDEFAESFERYCKKEDEDGN